MRTGRFIINLPLTPHTHTHTQYDVYVHMYINVQLCAKKTRHPGKSRHAGIDLDLGDDRRFWFSVFCIGKAIVQTFDSTIILVGIAIFASRPGLVKQSWIPKLAVFQFGLRHRHRHPDSLMATGIESPYTGLSNEVFTNQIIFSHV